MELIRLQRRLSEQWLELLRRAKFPFAEIQRLAESGGREPGRLFNIALSYQDSKILESRDASVLLSGAGITADTRLSSSAYT